MDGAPPIPDTDRPVADATQAQPEGTTLGASARHGRRVEYVLLAAILVAAAAIRLAVVDQQSLWGDELAALAQASTHLYRINDLLPVGQAVSGVPDMASMDEARPWWLIWQWQAGGDAHAPLYIIALRAWCEVFGDGTVASRMLSLVASLACVGLTYAIGRRLLGGGAGLWAAALMAVSLSQVAYGIEVRPYALLMALALAAAWLVLSIERHGPAWWRIALLTLLFWALPLIHYFVVGALVGLGLYVVLRLRGAARRRVILAACVAAAAFLILWGPSLWQQRTHMRYGFLEEQHPWHLRWTRERLLLLPLRYLNEARQESAGAVPYWHQLAGVLYLLPALRLRKRPELLLPYLWLLGSVGLVAGLDVARSTCHLSFIRYLFVATPAVFMLMSGMLSDAGRPLLRHLLPGGMLVYALMCLPSVTAERNEDWRAAGAYIAGSSHPNAPIVVPIPYRDRWRANVACIGISKYAYSPRRTWLVLANGQGVAPGQLSRGPVWVFSQRGATSLERLLPNAKIIQSRAFGPMGAFLLVSPTPATAVEPATRANPATAAAPATRATSATPPRVVQNPVGRHGTRGSDAAVPPDGMRRP